MGNPRPVSADMNQADQAKCLRRTDNGPTMDNEEELLHEAYGEPDDFGFFRGEDS
jgi:hypothetical protein